MRGRGKGRNIERRGCEAGGGEGVGVETAVDVEGVLDGIAPDSNGSTCQSVVVDVKYDVDAISSWCYTSNGTMI